MARKRDWNALSSSYQSRLLRKGITQQAYESGASLKAARGHAHTPEHPEDVLKQPSKYKKYMNKLKTLQQQAIERKEAIWGTRHKFNDRRSRERILRGEKPTINKPGVVALTRFLSESDETWERYVFMAAQGDLDVIQDDWNALFYH